MYAININRYAQKTIYLKKKIVCSIAVHAPANDTYVASAFQLIRVKRLRSPHTQNA